MAHDETAQRYRRAAEMTLHQLDWCIRYLKSIRHNDLARALSRNRNHIRQRLPATPAQMPENRRLG